MCFVKINLEWVAISANLFTPSCPLHSFHLHYSSWCCNTKSRTLNMNSHHAKWMSHTKCFRSISRRLSFECVITKAIIMPRDMSGSENFDLNSAFKYSWCCWFFLRNTHCLHRNVYSWNFTNTGWWFREVCGIAKQNYDNKLLLVVMAQ